MNILTPCALLLSTIISLPLFGNPAQAQEAPKEVRTGELAFAFASGAIQKTTPRDGIVNLITGDNQSTTNRMFLGIRDTFYLRLKNPADVAVGDLFTVYKQVRKVFHPLTNQYLGFVMLRLAVVQVTDTSHALTTVRALTSYGQISPGDPVMRYVPPATTSGEARQVDTGNLKGMIVEIQADKPMTMVSHHNVVYLDRGNRDGLQIGDLLDIQRRSGGLPVRKIGQIKVIATEEHTATAQVVKATARVFKGDRFTSTGQSTPIAQPGELTPVPALTTDRSPIPSDLVANTLKQSEVSGESRINLGNLEDSLRYESGEAAIKPDGYAVLDQLIDHLRTSGDTRLIRVEGHTDNVEIGPSLKARYPSNLELSKARAGNVARYLVEKGSVDSARLQSVGYGDRKPVATNTNEEGRSKNRRVEVVLYDPAVEPPASTSNPDNQLQPGEQSPSEVKTQGTISTIPSENNNSSPASAPENSSMPTEKPLTADSEGNPLETSNNPDAPAARPSGDQQDTQKTTGDPLGMDNGFPADEGLPSDGQQAAPKPADDPLGMDNGFPADEGLPSGGQQETQETASNMLSTEPSSSEYNPPLQETDMQSGDEPLSLSTDSVGF